MIMLNFICVESGRQPRWVLLSPFSLDVGRNFLSYRYFPDTIFYLRPLLERSGWPDETNNMCVIFRHSMRTYLFFFSMLFEYLQRFVKVLYNFLKPLRDHSSFFDPSQKAGDFTCLEKNAPVYISVFTHVSTLAYERV